MAQGWARRTDLLGAALVAIGCGATIGGVAMSVVFDESFGGVLAARAMLAGMLLIVAGVMRLDHVRRAQAASAPAEKGAVDGSPRLAGMLKNSDDVLATLRDIARNGGESFGPLPELLERAGLMSWESAPKGVGANRLGRNGRWWLRAEGGLDDEGYDRLVTVEAAINLAEDLERGLAPDVRAALARTADLAPHESDRGEERSLSWLLGDARPGTEWYVRLRLADYLENCPVPFRLSLELQANASEGLACIDLEVPRPRCFLVAGALDERELSLEARAYALRLALLAARGAIEQAGCRRVVVSCHEQGRDETVLSLDADAATLPGLLAAARAKAADPAALSDGARLRCRADGDGRALAVEPFLSRGDEALCPRERFAYVELLDDPASAELRAACGVERVSDLALIEKAGRIGAWNGIVRDLGDTTQEAVSRLMELRASTSDVTVAEACGRVSAALVEGAADVTDRRALAELFVDGGALEQATRRAHAALEGEPTPTDLEVSLAELERLLSPITDMGIYLDDATTVYRYFNSFSERVHYNRARIDGSRAVRLVPDEYYTAHALAARILSALGRPGDAMPHVDELVRVAPVTPDAALSKVRCLEDQSRIIEAAELLKKAIGYGATARDLAICFYRLAFMEWKLGRSDLAVACYQRAIELHADVAPQAKSELDDLLAGDGELKALPDGEVLPALKAGGIPVGRVGELRVVMRDALVACANDGLFNAARPLGGALIDLNRDDALIDAVRSLARP